MEWISDFVRDVYNEHFFSILETNFLHLCGACQVEPLAFVKFLYVGRW